MSCDYVGGGHWSSSTANEYSLMLGYLEGRKNAHPNVRNNLVVKIISNIDNANDWIYILIFKAAIDVVVKFQDNRHDKLNAFRVSLEVTKKANLEKKIFH